MDEPQDPNHIYRRDRNLNAANDQEDRKLQPWSHLNATGHKEYWLP